MKALARIVSIAALLAAIAARAAYATNADDIVGFWRSDDGEAVIRIFEREGKYHGAIAWLKEPYYMAEDGALAGKPLVDRYNRDASLRSRPLLGLEILHGLSFDGENRWDNGRIYNSRDGATYRCKVWLDDSRTLKLRGFIGVPLLGGTTTWTRTESPDSRIAG